MDKINLGTDINGLFLKSCIYNASGCRCTSDKELDELNNSKYCGAILSKSSTVENRVGNPKPRFFMNGFGSINSMGVPNFGYIFYMDYGKKHIDSKNNKPFIQSIIPFSIEDLETMLLTLSENFQQSKDKYTIEINLSCPNIVNKSIVAYDMKSFDSYLSKVQSLNTDNLRIGLKLPPYYEQHQFEETASIIKKYDKIKFITCINSVVNGLIIDAEKEETCIFPKNGLGGIGGSFCKPTALANVYNFYRLLGDQIDIIGCGGVVFGQDAFEHILCGASAVQIGTQLWKEDINQCFERVYKELADIMIKKGYKKIEDFKGKLKTRKEEKLVLQN